MFFNLPEEPNGGTPAFPALSIEQVPKDEGSELQAYVRKNASDKSNFIVPPKALTIDGRPGYEFGIGKEMIADFTNGGSATGRTADYEIVFQNGAVLYSCKMSSYPGADPKYLKVFEDFCTSVRFSK